jgi:diacylglycerol kinase family enzyme
MRTAVLIANPSASQFTGGLFRQVVTSLTGHFELETQWPVSGRDTLRHTRKMAAAGVDVVFAMGGDGVAHNVANGLIGSNTALGLIPAGTTNVLTRILGVPMNPRKAAEAAGTYAALPTRVARVRAHTDVGEIDMYATFSVGVGFDAAVVEAAEKRPYAKLRFGGVYYATTAIGRLTHDWRAKLANLRVEAQGESFDAVAALTQVHSPYTYFGRVPLHITKEPTIGLATIAVNNLGFANASGLLTRAVLRREHTERSGTHLWTDYDRITMAVDPPAPLQADGELLGTASHITIEPVEDGLTVLRPHEPEDLGTAAE